MKRILSGLCAACACVLLFSISSVSAQPPAGYSLHKEQEGLGVAPPAIQSPASVPKVQPKFAEPSVKSSDWVVMGYLQNVSPSWGYHWQALTHIALPFTDFDTNGNIANRTSSVTNRSLLFKPNGIADHNGVKVVIALRNSGFSTSVLDAVMQNAAKRTTLAQQVAAIVNNPSDNIAGVNFDFEPVPYSAGTGQAIVDFTTELRSLLNPGKEISYYVGPTYYSGSYPNLATAAESIDFFNISCYPYSGSWSASSRSVTPLSGYARNVDSFLNNGVPPEKMVLTLGTYGYSMLTTTADYGATKISNIGSTGYADELFATTLASPRRTREYQTGVESPWYAFASGENFESHVYEDEQSIELKMRNVQSWIGSAYPGRKLGGVGFWSLAWMGNNFLGGYSSYDVEAHAKTSKIRTYPRVYQAMQEVFAPPGEKEYILENWEYDSSSISGTTRSNWDRWRDPAGGLDNVGAASVTRSITATPAGIGKPPNSNFCNLLGYTFTPTTGNRFFYRWEILADGKQTSVRDFNATRGFFDYTTKVLLDVYTDTVQPNASISLVLLDSKGQLERTAGIPLVTTGWQTIMADIPNMPFTGYLTNYAQYNDGDGVIDTAGDGARDIAFIGVIVEGGGVAGSGTIYIDQLRYTHSNEGLFHDYKINEFAYRANDGEFVEIYGTPGVISAGTELRVYTSTNGDLVKTVDLSGMTIPESCVLAVGDPSVSGVASSAGFSDSADDLPGVGGGTQEATGLQLYNTVSGGVYDSVVYEAFGGIGLLVRPETHGVTAEGYPWLGEAASGPYSLGRSRDGYDTDVNNADFASLPLSPGQPNESAYPMTGRTHDFSEPVPSAFLTYGNPAAGIVPPGVTPSPNGGNVYRVADTSGGQMAFFGEALAFGREGYRVTGEFYIPASTESAQAIGLGICATLGSTFFEDTPEDTGYENGYWLLYQNSPSAVINDGLGDHAGTFKFVTATNDNMDGKPVEELASMTRAETGAAEGGWSTFSMEIDPSLSTLRAAVNGVSVYAGSIPAGGRNSGAFAGGHREVHPGGAASNEGLWLDNIRISPLIDQMDMWTFY